MMEEWHIHFIMMKWHNDEVNIGFENNFGSEGYTIYADKDRLNQVISNLVNNAIKFTDDGIIKINADAVINKKDDGTDSRTLMISIKDNGKGIDPNIMHKLFTKFTTSGSDKGTGIGLYLSKKIIEAHGGTIRAYNNEGEKGATFSFSLPQRCL
jgi:two-component system sensor histidine kinase VicK